MKKLYLLMLATLLAACSFRSEKLFSSYANLEVREVGRSLQCHAAADGAAAVILPDLQAVLDWETSRAIQLAPSESLLQAPYALIEMGLKPTGGYGLAVARAAVLRGELLLLQATFVAPAPGSIVTQAQSSPCVLVELPAGRYSSVEVKDQAGEVRASGVVVPRSPAAAQ